MKFKKIDTLISIIVLIVVSYALFTFIKNKKNKKVTLDNYQKTTIAIVPDTIIDFGKIKEGKIMDFNFKIKNTGANKLYVRNFASSCGCTTINNSKEDVEQSDSTEIYGKIDTKGKFGKSISVIRFLTNTESIMNKLSMFHEVIK